METTNLLNEITNLHNQLQDLKIIAVIALIIATVATIGMFIALFINIKNNNTLGMARESQLVYFSRVDEMLNNQLFFRSGMKDCIKILEANAHSLNENVKPTLQNIKNLLENQERRLQIKTKQGIAKNHVSINTAEHEKIQQLQRTIQYLTSKE